MTEPGDCFVWLNHLAMEKWLDDVYFTQECPVCAEWVTPTSTGRCPLCGDVVIVVEED